MPLSDAEIICTWMEPRPVGPRTVVRDGWSGRADFSEHYWWMWFYPRNPNTGDPRDAKGDPYWIPINPLTLDRLHLVEARLQLEAKNPNDPRPCSWRNRYADLLAEEASWLWHIDAPTKILALATVLRPLVESEGSEKG